VIEYLIARSNSPREQIMTDASAQQPGMPKATVSDVMHPPVTTVEQNDHVAGAAYLMKRAGATALVVTLSPRLTSPTWSPTATTRTTSASTS
jgi:signal-transduction protein with cAMP-binding, CBS, and nucleotidyltransferase domain